VSFSFQSVFIISYGRSGSTLLQGILNSADGVMIKGENGNVFSHFYSAYRELLAIQANHLHATRPVNPWFGSCWLNVEQFKHDLYVLGKNLLLQTDNCHQESIQVFGFKEIRYATMADPISYIRFLLDIFPGSCVIHLTRNHQEVATSQRRKFKKQQFEPASIISELKFFDNLMKDFGNGNPSYHRIDYSDLKGPDLSRVRLLFEFLGAPYHEERIRRILDKPHSY